MSSANTELNPLQWSVPFSLMNPFWIWSTTAEKDKITANLILGYSLPPAPCLSGSQPVYNERGIVIFGTCNQIYEQQRTIEASVIA
jgi:hypothetical protein